MLAGDERRVVVLISEGELDIVKCTQDLVRFKTVTPSADGRVEWDMYRALQSCGYVEYSRERGKYRAQDRAY